LSSPVGERQLSSLRTGAILRPITLGSDETMLTGMRVGAPDLEDASLHYRRGSLFDSIAALAEMGYDAVELDLKDPDEVDVNALRRVLRDNNITWCGMGTGRLAAEDGLTFTDPNPDIRRRAIEAVCRLIEMSAEFGAMPMIGRVRHDVQNLSDRDTQYRRMVEGLTICAAHAVKCGHVAMLENITRYINPSCNTVAATMQCIREVNSPGLKMMLDTYHCWLEERSFYGSIVECGSELVYVHMSDSNREAPGYGLIDYSEVIGVLKAMGYSGPLVCEVLMKPDCESVAEDSLALMRSLLTKHGVRARD
jgi:5-keto-L-gluconate epimerase